jgi:hypothetical protein
VGWLTGRKAKLLGQRDDNSKEKSNQAEFNDGLQKLFFGI